MSVIKINYEKTRLNQKSKRERGRRRRNKNDLRGSGKFNHLQEDTF